MNRKILLLFAALLLILAVAAGCQKPPAGDPTQPPAEKPVEQLALVVTEDTIGLLENYPDLRSLDLTGSTCYAAIAQYIKDHPRVDVTYTVSLGSLTVAHNETALVLDPGICDYETLAANLEYLPDVTQVRLPRTPYTARELIALEGLYPEVTWDYSIVLLGQELTKDTTQVNLSVLTSDRVAEAVEILSVLPQLTSVELMDAYGQCALAREDVALLMDAAPKANFHYAFDLFGKTVSTQDTRLEFIKQDIGDADVEELRSALQVLRSCEYLLLDSCDISNDVLAALREEFRHQTQVVWRVRFGLGGCHSYLTDTVAILAPYNVDDDTCAALRYCENVKYLDLSNNGALHDTSYLAFMPDLEICILSGCPVSDLTPLASAAALQFLELAHCGHLEDITPLADCPNLEYLNLSYTKVDDVTALHGLQLKQFCAVVSTIPYTQQVELTERMPECVFRFDGSQAYGTGWRYTKSGAYTDIYAHIRQVFGLDEKDGK